MPQAKCLAKRLQWMEGNYAIVCGQIKSCPSIWGKLSAKPVGSGGLKTPNRYANKWIRRTHKSQKRADLTRPPPLSSRRLFLGQEIKKRKQIRKKQKKFWPNSSARYSDCDSFGWKPFSGGPPWVFCCSNLCYCHCHRYCFCCNCYCYQLCMQFIFKEIIALPHVGQHGSASFELPAIMQILVDRRCFCSFRSAFLYNNKERQVKEWPVFAYNLIWIWISHTQCTPESGIEFNQ